MNGKLAVLTEEESMLVSGGGIEQALGYASGASAAWGLSGTVFGTVTGTAALTTTGVLVASGLSLGLLAVGLAGAAVYSLFN